MPVPALFYLEMKAFNAASEWSFATTALALCLAVVVAGLGGSEVLRRLLPDRDLRAELRLLVHVGQVALAAGLTAFALQGVARSTAAPGCRGSGFGVNDLLHVRQARFPRSFPHLQRESSGPCKPVADESGTTPDGPQPRFPHCLGRAPAPADRLHRDHRPRSRSTERNESIAAPPR